MTQKMTLNRVADILGSGMGPESFGFLCMIQALKMHSWNNTPEETERLEAALWAKAHRKAYRAEIQRRRDLPLKNRRGRT